MTKRQVFVVAIITTLIGIQSVFVVVGLPEAWPFSNYPMFSKSSVRSSATNYTLEGITTDGLPIELSVRHHFQPYNVSKLRIGLGTQIRKPDSTLRDESLLHVMQYLSDVYEENRRRRRHTGPPIRELRLYRVAYDWTDVPLDSVIAVRTMVYALDLEGN